MIITKFIVVMFIGYLLGSIPFGAIIGKRSAGVDVTKTGSGKTGMTNVLRSAGKKAAALVLALDICKGLMAVFFARLLFGDEYLLVGSSVFIWLTRSAQVVAALSALAGHIWSVFLSFKGGRGVATFFGGLAALYPPAALFGAEVLVIGAGLTRYMSIGSIAGAVSTYAILIPLTLINGFPIEYITYSLIGAILIIYMHRDNISRLLAGRERRLGEKSS